MDRRDKYVYKPASCLFPELFQKEKKRIEQACDALLQIEHIGSTAIPGLGGKGIIDIAIAAKKHNWEATKLQLQSLGYVYRESFSTENRLYFVAYLADPLEGERRYHIHLMEYGCQEWKELLSFRDYLLYHPKAAQTAQGDGDLYRQIKEPIFKKIRDFRIDS